MADVARIAMWSGPRTLSTALMRSFGSRADTVVIDEPLYAFYLARTGIEHPGRNEILASMPTDWRQVLSQLAAGPVPPGTAVYYQKHMAHHLLPWVDRAALAGLRHAFLIRDPRRLLASYARVRAWPTLADLGLEQQAEIFRRFGGPVVDAGDIVASPRRTLAALCGRLGIPFDEAMLSWAPGPRPTDGVWARYWYARVRASTGFGTDADADAEAGAAGGAAATAAVAAGAGQVALPPGLEPLADQCAEFYAELAAHRIGAAR